LAPLRKITLFIFLAFLVVAIFFRRPQQSPTIGSISLQPVLFRMQASNPRKIDQHSSTTSDATLLSDLQSLSLRVREQSGSNEQELKIAYHEAQALIEKNQAEALSALQADLPRLVEKGTLRESFFMIGAFTRSLSHPEEVLRAVWKARSDHPNPSQEEVSHHEALTPEVKELRMEAYAVKELRRRLNSGFALSSDEVKVLVQEVLERVSSEKSLDVSLELFELMQHLDANEEIEVALQKRSEADRTFIKRFLNARERV
jgi:hypothetical protein